VGPDGSGKTCLALAAAHLQVGMFADGVFFVPVEAQSGPAPLAGAIASALGLFQAAPFTAAVPFAADAVPEPYQKILEYLRDKEMLLVLDHCEKALAAQAGECMDFLATVLQQAAQVKLLVTSRMALNLRSECVLEINKT
jgi:predicted ATPase